MDVLAIQMAAVLKNAVLKADVLVLKESVCYIGAKIFFLSYRSYCGRMFRGVWL